MFVVLQFLEIWGVLWAVTDNNTAVDLPPGSMNVAEFFD
jgi:hypothetical protein